MMHRCRTMVVALTVAVAAVGAAGVAPASAVSVSAARPAPHAPKLADPAKTAKALLTEWITAVQQGDTAKIGAMLAPDFQLARTDGTVTTRAEYLANPSKVTTFTFADEMQALQAGDSLTVYWGVKVTGDIGGVNYVDATAPRLTGFVWRKGRWQMITYANFSPRPPAG